jgi:hypothetical protein
MNAAEKYRAKVKEKTFELELPSGNTIKVIVPPLHTWIAMGQVPPFFLKAVSNLWGGAGAESVLQMGLSEEEQFEIVKTFCELIIAACVEPRVVERDPADGEIAITEMPAADRDKIAAWCLAGGPGLSIPTAGGEVEPERLTSFPDATPGHTNAAPRGNLEDVRLPS